MSDSSATDVKGFVYAVHSHSCCFHAVGTPSSASLGVLEFVRISTGVVDITH